MRPSELRFCLKSALLVAGSLLTLLIAAAVVSAQPPPQRPPSREPLGPDGQFSRHGERPPRPEVETVDLEQAPRVHWMEAADGKWHDPARWQGGRVPGPGDVAVIDAPGRYTVELESDAEVAAVQLGGSDDARPTLHLPGRSLKILAATRVAPAATLHLDGGIVTGPGDLLIDGLLSWTGGSMSGAAVVRVSPTGRVVVTGDERKFLSLRSLESSGEVTWSGGGDWVVTFNSAVRNLAGGRFHVEADALFDVYGPPGPRFENAGSFTRAGGGATVFEAPFSNAGTVEVTAGELELLEGYTQTGGTTQVAAGAAIRSPRQLDVRAGTVGGEGEHPRLAGVAP